MTDVFISYKKEDVDRVQPMAEGLAKAGYDIWWDHRIPPGRTYRDVIGAALQAAKCVIVVWSENSTKSQWVLDEADVGAKRRVLLPILIDDILPPLGFTQIEAARLVHWDGDEAALEWQHTLEAVGHLVGRAPGEAPPVQISMPSSGAAADSPAITRATPGAIQAQAEAAVQRRKSGGGMGWILPALLATVVLGGGAYFAVTNNLFSGSPSDNPKHVTETDSKFPGVHGWNVMSATAPANDGSGELVFTRNEDGRWYELTPAREPAFSFEEQGREENAVTLFDPVRRVNLELDLARARVGYAAEGEAMYDIHEITDASSEMVSFTQPQPQQQQGFPGINGSNVQSIVTDEGRIAFLKDGYWGAFDDRPLPENTYEETGRDEWSVYLRRVPDGARFQIDTYKKVMRFQAQGRWRDDRAIESASRQGAAVPRIADANFFMFGPELRFERVERGAQPIWQEFNTRTDQWGARWTQVRVDEHVMELADDGRDARMRVDLIQAQVYLYFPDWGQFQPQWKITEMH
jgi:hypothetical protein